MNLNNFLKTMVLGSFLNISDDTSIKDFKRIIMYMRVYDNNETKREHVWIT